MQTDKIKIQDYETGLEQALQEMDKFCTYMEYSRKNALRVKLLVEESYGMLRAVAEKFVADFWLEGKNDGTCLVHLTVYTDMDILKKRELIDVSKNKKNAAYPGLAGKIREIIEDSIYFQDNPKEGEKAEGGRREYMMMTLTNNYMAPGAPMPMDGCLWTLESYRQSVETAIEADGETEEAEEAWDELEKSILAHLADDIRVAVKGNTAEIVIEKKFGS